MAKTVERKCIICGKTYEYCTSCNHVDKAWKFLFHDEKCRDMNQILAEYRGNEITKEVAKERLSKFKPNIDNALKHDSMTAKEIQEIFRVKQVEVDENNDSIVNNEDNVEQKEKPSKGSSKQNKNKEIKE